jgi:tetratricopeptide (TPR) repeat protein
VTLLRFSLGLATAIAFSASGCGALEPPVVRSVDGVTSEGRFIDPDAYALYAVAALREARGQWPEALRLYERALELDDRGPELHTRIGSVRCKLQQSAEAERAFASAERTDGTYGPLWFERAQCWQAQGKLRPALAAALTAIRLDPERHEASLLAADLAERSGDTALAWQLRDALATHAADSPQVLRSVLQAARRGGQVARAARAEAALQRLPQKLGASPPPRALSHALTLLERGDVGGARRQAELVLGADPGSADALVIALAAADLEQDHAGFNALLAMAGEPGAPASPEVLTTLAALLGRRISAQAAQLVKPQP